MSIIFDTERAIGGRHSLFARPFAWIADAITHRSQERRNRTELSALLKLDDAMLRDLGVTRDQVTFVLGQPIGTDASAMLNRDSRRSSYGPRRR